MSYQSDQAYEQIRSTYGRINRHAAAYAKAYHAGDLDQCSTLLHASYNEIDNLYNNTRLVVDDMKSSNNDPSDI